MFPFSRDSERSKLLEVQSNLVRLANLATPNLLHRDADVRSGSRVNRTLPVLVAPWIDGAADTDACTIGLTKDVSDRGVALVLPHPVACDRLIVGFWPTGPDAPDGASQPYFFVGEIRHNSRLGGGFWQIGVQLTEFANTRHPSQIERLIPFATRLLPSPVPRSSQVATNS